MIALYDSTNTNFVQSNYKVLLNSYLLITFTSRGRTKTSHIGINDDSKETAAKDNNNPKETYAEDHDNLKETDAEYDANSKESADGNSKETSDEDDDNSWETADEDDDNSNSKEKAAVASNDKEGTAIRETITPSIIKMDDPVADCTRLSDNETVKPYPKCERGPYQSPL